jgi:hypothetical protein
MNDQELEAARLSALIVKGQLETVAALNRDVTNLVNAATLVIGTIGKNVSELLTALGSEPSSK